MKKLLKSFLRVGTVLALLFLVVFFSVTLVSFSVKNRLKEFDGSYTIDGLEYGFGTIVIRNLKIPEKGITAGRVSVLVGGSLFHPVPRYVILEDVIFQPVSSPDSAGTGLPADDLPLIHVVHGEIPGAGTHFNLTRRSGLDMGSARGTWGEIVFNRRGDSFSAVFSDCASLPGIEEAVPELLRGHRISGFCSGLFGQNAFINGYLTMFDGEPARAAFEYQRVNGVPSARLSMDFSQVAEPAMAMLDSLSSGAFMTAVPSGSLSVMLSESDSIRFEMQLAFDSLSVFSQAIAPDTFSTRIDLNCSGFVMQDPGFVVIDSGTIEIGQAEVFFNLEYSFGERRKLKIALWNPGLSGEAVSASIPPEFLGCLRGLSLAGELSFRAEVTLDWDCPDSCDVEIDVDASRLSVAYSPVSFDRLRSGGGWECIMRDSWGNTAVVGIDAVSNPNFISLNSLPSCFEPLLCCSEDGTFRSHHGFSEYHIRNSLIADMEHGSFIRGGSTISMQLAKNMFLGREKTLSRKLQEVFLTWRLESWLSKDRILEIYANIVELGPNVFGFNSAALYYFNERVSDISVRETAFLISILPGPRLYHRFGVQGELPGYWDTYLDRLLSICGDRGWLADSVVSEALAETLVFDGPVSGR